MCLCFVFRRGWVSFSADFRRKVLRPLTTVGVKKTRVTALVCGIISAVHYLVLLRSTCVTDRRTDEQTDGENYNSQDYASIAASRGKYRFWLGL